MDRGINRSAVPRHASGLSNFSKRNMTIDMGDQRNTVVPSAFSTERHSVGPIALPQDFTPQAERKHKNQSLFTNSLLAGDAPGYGHIQGGPKAGRQSNML